MTFSETAFGFSSSAGRHGSHHSHKRPSFILLHFHFHPSNLSERWDHICDLDAPAVIEATRLLFRILDLVTMR